MRSVYFDNAATTPMHPEVVKVMQKSMLDNFGNPSSTHHTGRKAKVAIEKARKDIASHFNVPASQFIFTSSGTEANNLILNNAVLNLGVKRIITSKIEHKAVLEVVESLADKYEIELCFVDVNRNGSIDLKDLEIKLAQSPNVKTLVSLMMLNNEIGTILPIKEVSILCKENGALFHSDTVQVIGHYELDLSSVEVDFIVASAHKFHGPKGIGFLYFSKNYFIQPMIVGGGQERGIRSSTENVHGILGMQKALEISIKEMEVDKSEILKVKTYFLSELQKNFPDITTNGILDNDLCTSYSIVNVRFPVTDKMFLFNLDLKGVAASAGSACQSGASKVSHVLKEILTDEEISKTSIRFSFSKFSTLKEVDYVIEKMKEIFYKNH